MLIRRAELNDKNWICNLHTAATLGLCKTHYSEHQIQAWIKYISPALYHEVIQKQYAVVAMNGRRLVGFGAINLDNFEIDALYVSPQASGKGIGLGLLKILENKAKRMGATRMQLYSTLNAVAFYSRASYRIVQAAVETLPDGVELDCVYMEKIIRSQSDPELRAAFQKIGARDNIFGKSKKKIAEMYGQ